MFSLVSFALQFLHTGLLTLPRAVKQNLSTITSYLLSLNPSLLYRENATGRTPLEMSRDIYISSRVSDPPNIATPGHQAYGAGQTDWNFITNKPPQDFLPKKPVPEESKKRTWEICEGVDADMEKEGKERKRRLVSLFEANEVAKRVANIKRGWGGGRQMVVNGGVVNGEEKPDIVSEWL
jgi:hypothetical protein